MSDLMRILPAIALRGTTILPGMIVHFDISRDKSIKAVETAMMKDQVIYLVTQRDPEAEDPGMADLYKIGTIAEIKQVVKAPKNTLRILVEGLERAEILGLENNDKYLEAEVAAFDQI